MPSPVGHALGGLIVGLVLAPDLRSPERHDAHHGIRGLWVRGLRALRIPQVWQPVVGWCAIVACLPDVDFLWGRHNMETHSVGFALLLGAATLVWQRSSHRAAAVMLAAGTHVLFDWLGSDDAAPLGVMALWPFSREFFYADLWLFAAISRRYWLPWFVEQNMLAVLRELALLLPIVVVVAWYRTRKFPAGNAAESRVPRHRRRGGERRSVNDL